ncbi:S-adenosyl-L-methionine-dependent methyltransferase [Pseudovirgaria hyperparasitica]|uniref:S-adenosyl-L-methionine-dependent methyltransferase n=1 Tax=Pseudovirgaria hyperparasitica TaxID=470096 RepID=A0A6A6W4B7_9PEZI|nr:S-adenosyl-L-methionine-dependent methyltransferase [Pseudovirgaria hyperparasitica]KAF2756407.1 S-adenosyl-L-methionine-dependent methyltransferase [Pseudovirgaria hyperparasitica]
MSISVGSPEWYRQMKDVKSDVGRLTINHYGFKQAANGELIFAPLDFSSAPRKVLDVATADGLWMRDVQSSIPAPPHGEHVFVGTEINEAFFPSSHPENISFVLQDMNKPGPESWSQAFDLVHMRLALLAATSPQAVIEEHMKYLKPGAWLVIGDCDRVCPTSEAENPYYHMFFKVMRAVLTKMRADPDVALKSKAWLEEAGFEDVQEHMVMRQVGKRNPDETMAEKAAESDLIITAGMANNAKGLDSSLKPYTDEILDDLAANLGKELRDQGALFPMRFIWGRKPQ